MKIVVDAMGGDHAPEAIVKGAVLAAQEYNTEIILTGLSDQIKTELDKHDSDRQLPIEIVHARTSLGPAVKNVSRFSIL